MGNYWYSDPCILYSSFNIFPFFGESQNDNYNSLTRLIILLTIIISIFSGDYYIQVISLGLISIFLSVVIYEYTHSDAVNRVISRTVLEKQDLADHEKTIDFPKGKESLKLSATTGNIYSKKLKK